MKYVDSDCADCYTPSIPSVTQPPASDRYLARCRGCGQWKDERVECIVCRPPGSCVECKHPVREHSSEPGIGCLHADVIPPMPFDTDDVGQPGTVCPCIFPGTSGADQ